MLSRCPVVPRDVPRFIGRICSFPFQIASKGIPASGGGSGSRGGLLATREGAAEFSSARHGTASPRDPLPVRVGCCMEGPPALRVPNGRHEAAGGCGHPPRSMAWGARMGLCCGVGEEGGPAVTGSQFLKPRRAAGAGVQVIAGRWGFLFAVSLFLSRRIA